ncbi:protein maelstrom homolog [Lutzomyia longipalpis]|uniref:protein maelstrom homolog n=1 Tax=Lutzomyia longipalpis TaxID=7200 RepID=UPI002483AE11|nr:protein maelstrom homolog [Lutzomyia longipalpis]
MPPKKRPPFFHFMLEVQKAHEKAGQHYAMSEMPAIASPLWERMTKEERAKYERMSKESSGQPTSSHINAGSIKTCHGIDHAEVEREQRQAANQEKKMKDDVRDIINRAILAQDLGQKTFFVIHINYFCESMDPDGARRYDAAELAILDFSLQDGIKRGMHTFMKLHTLPYGYGFEASRYSKETHQLPLPPDTIGNTTIREALQEVLRFIGHEEGVWPPIFTSDTDIPVVQSIFREVLSQVAGVNVNDVRIYSLSQLLFHMKNATHSQATKVNTEQPFASIFLAESYLKRETFDYSEGLPCEYHVDIDRVTHCSQTKVKGWAYSIIHTCAPDLDIEFVEGKHEPMMTLAVPQLKFPDDESFSSFFTASNVTPRAIPVSHTPSVNRHNDSNLAQFPVAYMSTYAENTEDVSMANTDEFPLMREFKRGKGRGNLL